MIIPATVVDWLFPCSVFNIGVVTVVGAVMVARSEKVVLVYNTVEPLKTILVWGANVGSKALVTEDWTVAGTSEVCDVDTGNVGLVDPSSVFSVDTGIVVWVDVGIKVVRIELSLLGVPVEGDE